MAEQPMIADLRKAVEASLDATEQRAMLFREHFLKFSHLWTKQPNASLQVNIIPNTNDIWIFGCLFVHFTSEIFKASAMHFIL